MYGINKSAQRKADALVDSTGGLKATDGNVDGSGSADGSAASTKKEQAARSDLEDLPATIAEVALCWESNRFMHSIDKGDITVAVLTAKFLQCGFIVLRPVTENSRYDLVIDRGRGFERVQCKTAIRKADSARFNTASCYAHQKNGKGRRSYHGEIDLFGVFLPDFGGQCYLIPVACAANTAMTLRLTPAKNGQSKGVNFASDYIL